MEEFIPGTLAPVVSEEELERILGQSRQVEWGQEMSDLVFRLAESLRLSREHIDALFEHNARRDRLAL